MSFDGVVFAGGGCRCFWQAGFYSTVAPEMSLRPKAIAAASAGAALACVAITGKAERGLEVFAAKAASNSKNLYPRHWRTAKPVFPHEQLFRSAILDTLDAETFHRIKSGPEFCVALTRAPATTGLGPMVVFAGVASYILEGMVTARIHKQWPKRLGFVTEWARADRCNSVQELADLLLHTSCTPPFTPAFERDGRPVFDGGLSDNVPVSALGDCQRVLVLLTRPTSSIPSSGRICYASPSKHIAVKKWDYTDPAGLHDAFLLGKRDAEVFCRQHI